MKKSKQNFNKIFPVLDKLNKESVLVGAKVIFKTLNKITKCTY